MITESVVSLIPPWSSSDTPLSSRVKTVCVCVCVCVCDGVGGRSDTYSYNRQACVHGNLTDGNNLRTCMLLTNYVDIHMYVITGRCSMEQQSIAIFPTFMSKPTKIIISSSQMITCMQFIVRKSYNKTTDSTVQYSMYMYCAAIITYLHIYNLIHSQINTCTACISYSVKFSLFRG